MNAKYAPLFQPYRIGKHIFKNRILSGPLGVNEDNTGAGMLQVNVDYYGAIARGGAARVIGGGDAVINENGGYNGGMGRIKLYLDPIPMDVPNSIRNYVNTIHRYNALAFVQLSCDGGPSGLEPFPGPIKGLGPSAKLLPNGSEVIEMTKEDLERIKADYVKCAVRAKEYGVDGIVFHVGHGKLLDQFRAPDCNFRTDEYGGSVENRCRFPIEVMCAVREAVGPDLILEYRTSVHEYQPNGITIEESIAFFKLLEEKHVVDLFHVTAGRHTDPKSNNRCISPATFPAAQNREFCRQIKAAGVKTPLVIVNSCADPDVAADIIASGDADFINLSRQLNLADPYYPRKLREGNEHLIDNCLRCHACYDVIGPCSVNPHATFKTYEAAYPLKKARIERTVCVIGGGIGGLKAAYTAAERGHKVVILEKDEVLGGQLRFADTDTMKTDIRRYKDNMIKRVVEHPNIEVRLGVTATPEMVQQMAPYAVIAAVGAETKKPEIPGVDRENVITVHDAYLRPELLRGKLLMVGSGLTACEVALHLNNNGHKITIMGRRESICFHENFTHGPSALYNPVPTFYDWFEERGIDVHHCCECIAVVDGGTMVRDLATGEERLLEADTVILSSGMCAKTEEAYAFSACGDYFALVGDCIHAGKIRNAVSTGYWAAMEI